MLPWAEDRCFKCALRIEDPAESVICLACQNSSPPFDRLSALFSYDPPVTRLVTGLKFGENLTYGKILGELLADAVTEKWYKKESLPQAILPVPLHKKRIQKRGFNQALELLRPLRKRYAIPIILDEVTRIRHTSPQSELNEENRKQNLKNAFKVHKPLKFEHVAILDDVVTTGSTVHALSLILRECGVQQIDIWSICRA